jgi:hypothetical protein
MSGTAGLLSLDAYIAWAEKAIIIIIIIINRYQWPRGLRRRFTAAHVL